MHGMAPEEPLTVFISARRREMAAERAIAAAVVASMRLRPVLFEHARLSPGVPPVFLEAARGCDIFVGIFGDEYGDAEGNRPSAIEQEFQQTMQTPLLPRLLLVRRSRSRQRRLQGFLHRAAPHATLIPFAGPDECAARLKSGLALLLARGYRDSQSLEAESADARHPAGTAPPDTAGGE